MTNQEKLNALRETRAEITRLNKAAGRTVFNPATTDLLQQVIDEITAKTTPRFHWEG